MSDRTTTALLRTILDEICASVSRSETGARTHVATKDPRSRQQGRDAARGIEADPSRCPLAGGNHVALTGRGAGVNFQVTVLKILVSYPDGFAVMDDLKRDMALLATSGRDWADRTRRLAARVPDLDIFSQGLVARERGGWKITVEGRAVLESMEARPPIDEQIEVAAVEPSGGAIPPLPQPAERAKRRRERRERRREAAERARAAAS